MKSEKEVELRVRRVMGRWYNEPVFSKNKYIESAYLFFWRYYYKLTSGLFYICKYFLQRLVRGYDDLDKWNAAWYISKKAIPVLKAMRNSFHGTSIKLHIEDRHGEIIELSKNEVFTDEPVAFTEEEWRDILDDIIFAFQFVINQDDAENDLWVNYSEETYNKNYKRYKRGIKLLSIYFMNLWD